MHILEALDFHARFRPNDLAIIYDGGAVTFLHLRHTVLGTAMRVRAAGLNPDLPVGVYVNDPFLHFALVLALMHEAIPSFSGHPNYDPPPAGVEFGAYLCDRQMPFMQPAAIVTVDASWATPLAPGAAGPDRRLFKSPHSLVRIIASSGTTGVPKAAGFDSEMIDRGIEFPAKIGSLGEQPNITAIGLASGLGFRHCLGHLRLGNTQVFTSARLDMIGAIMRFNVKFVTASPVQIQALLEFVERGMLRLPSLKHVRVAGSVISPVTVLRARARLCPNVTGDYGATEVGMVAEAPAELLERIPGCAGYVHPWNKVEIVDDADRPLPFGAEGIVRIRSRSIVSGYLGDPPENRTAFKDGWFYPGDLGTMTKEGLLIIAGRVSEVINAGGVKVSPDLINSVLLGMQGVVDAAAFGVQYPDRPTEIWTAVVTPQPLDEGALIESCRKTLGGRAPQRIVRVEHIPRNSMGKILTAELRRQVTGRP